MMFWSFVNGVTTTQIHTHERRRGQPARRALVGRRRFETNNKIRDSLSAGKGTASIEILQIVSPRHDTSE